MREPSALATLDWNGAVRVALGGASWLDGLVGGGLHILCQLAEHTTAPDPAGDEAMSAATLLGVPLDAGVDEIRAALRTKLSATRLHPDHGGNESEAKRFIAAKNFLVERARTAPPT